VRRAALLLPAALLVAAALLLASGRDGDDGNGELRVSAAASLKRPLTEYGERFGDVRLSFAGSDELAAQIRRGARPDVFAAADVALPQALFEEGLVERPRVFAANRLVIAIPRGSRKVRTLEDLARSGTSLAVGAPTVPVGAYTREALRRLGRDRAERILANVRSNEPDVAGVVGKVAQGGVDAGFVYATDVEASGGRLEAIELPELVQPQVLYAVAVVEGAPNPDRARELVRGLVSDEGRRILREAGFDSPPPPAP
jgi:molybdate transport system substrate-binding protein